MNNLEICLYSRPHVLCRIDTNASDSDSSQCIKITSHFAANVIGATVKVGKSDEITIAHLINVVIVFNISWALKFVLDFVLG